MMVHDELRRHRLAALVQKATEMAAHWQHLGNLAHERGNEPLAERHYQRSQKWRDRMNLLLGNGDGGDP